MSFHSLEYALFFAAVFAVFWALRGRHLLRTALLVVASGWFYTRFDYGKAHEHLGKVYLALLAATATLDFSLSHAIHAVDRHPRAIADRAWGERRRKTLLIVSVVYNLGLLSYFKYTNFAIDSVRQMLGGAASALPARSLDIVLPIGISFFTFETMSYTIDVYRRELVPAAGHGRGLVAIKSWGSAFLEYLVFVSFFPHLVAGPIIRPKDMLPQLRADPEFREERAGEGIFLIATGLLKKVVIADYLALNQVDRVFDRPELFSAPEVLAGIYGYAFQIYCDFSGYTDIAIGSALLLGYVLPKNFDSPYKARNLQEFWHRWHISLSTWLRDYLYIPLGGSRGSPWKTYRNLVLTMLLGGLWHSRNGEAPWNFLIWGGLHGLALAVTRMWQRARPGGRDETDRSRRAPVDLFLGSLLVFAGLATTIVLRGGGVDLRVVLAWGAIFLGVLRLRRGLLATHGAARAWREVAKGLLTFHYVCFAWVFFRAEGFRRACAVLERLVVGGTHVTNLPRGIVWVLALAAVTHLLPDDLYARMRRVFVALPAPAQAALLFAVAVVLKKVATTQVVPFVYFQF
jgi:D-alanyl-lipoteichoic acid acyltransferase DltB (MBOAT superfamily)